MSRDTTDLREQVRARYAEAAISVTSGSGASCCAPATTAARAGGADERFGAALYERAATDDLPAAAVLASLGCGNPTAVVDLRPGDRVLDLGSGGGIDVLLSAERVGPTGFAYGVDMTDEMLDLARANAAEAGATNVEFRAGTIEDLPFDDASIDVVISNCVVNLCTDKPAVLAEMHRVLAPGGRVGISDVVAEDDVTPEQRAERGSYVGCIAGALSRAEYLAGLADVGFADVTVVFTHEVAPGLHGAVVRASKPADVSRLRQAGAPSEVSASCCTPVQLATCCEPSAKPSCCGTGSSTHVPEASPQPTSCGCRP